MSNNEIVEALIVLNEDDADRTRIEVEKQAQVLHSVSPRVFVVMAEARALEDLSRMENVVAATDAALPGTVLRTLDGPERQWAAAWNLRRVEKSRPGDGLPWDAAGFSPPDRPD
jgi:hypothetical protein